LRAVFARASVAFASSAAIIGDWSETAQELIYETNRDVKWICDALQRMEARDEDFEGRLRALEAWRSEKAGEERRVSALGAGAGGIVGGVVAVIVRVIGGG